MKEKTIISILGVAVVIVGIAAFLRSNDVAKPRPKKEVSGSTVETGPGGKLAEIPAELAGAGSLPADVQALVVFKPRNVDAAIKRWQGTRDRLTTTAVWKKFDLGGQLQQKFQEGFNQGAANSPDGTTPEKIRAELTALLDRWQGLDEAVLAVSAKTKNYKLNDGKEMPLPGLLVQFTFVKEQLATDSYAVLTESLLKGQDRAETPDATIVKKSGTELELLLRGGAAPEKNLPATIRLEGPVVRALFNAAPGDFQASAGAPRFADSPEWKNAAAISPEGAAMFSFFNLTGAISAIDRILDVLPPESLGPKESIKELKANLALYRDFDSLWFGVNMTDGLKVTSCVMPRPGTSFEGMYSKLFAARSSGAALISQTPLLIDEQTIFALGISTDTIAGSLGSIKEQVKAAFTSTATDDEESKNINSLVDAAERAMNELKLKEIGLFVSPPLMPPIVGAGILLGGSELKGEALLKQIAASVNELAKTAHKALGNEPAPDMAEVAPGGDGAPELHLNVGGLMLVGSVVKENSVLISIDSAIVSTMAKRLDASSGYLAKVSSPAGLGKLVSESDYFLYLNTATVIDLGRNFLPLLLAQQPQEPKVDVNDANEVLDLLKFSYLSFQRSYQSENKAVCSDSRGYVLQ